MKRVFAVLLMAMVSGCAITDSHIMVTGDTKPVLSPDEVRIYTTAPQDYEELGWVSASAGHDFMKDSELLELSLSELKEKAASVGANGVLVTEIAERDAVRTSSSFANAVATGSDGSSVSAYGNGVSVDWGDTYTRVKGIAIYVPSAVSSPDNNDG